MFYGLLGGCLWALDTVILSIAMKPFAFDWAAPIISTGLHDLLSALWMSLYITIKRKWTIIWKALKRKESHMVMLAALLGGPVGMMGYVFAVRYLGASLTAAISSFYPALAAIISFLFFKEKMSKSQIFGLIVSLSCIALMSAGQSSQSANFLLGLFFALLCVFGWSLEGVIIQHNMKNSLDNEICLFLRQTTSAFIFSAVLIPILSSYSLAFSVSQVSGWVLVLAALCGTASYLSYYKAIGSIGAVKAMPLNSTYCAWAVVFDFILQGIVPSTLQIFLCIGIIAGAILCAGILNKKS